MKNNEIARAVAIILATLTLLLALCGCSRNGLFNFNGQPKPDRAPNIELRP